MGDERQEIVSNIIMIHAASCQQLVSPLFCVRTSFAICPQAILFVMGWWGLLL